MREEGGCRQVSITQSKPGSSIAVRTHNLLLQGKHIVVEELVQLLIRVVDAQLLK